MQAVIRAVCTILDAFHFSPEAESQPVTEPPEDSLSAASGRQEVEAVEEVEDAEADGEAEADLTRGADSGRDIANTLARRVLPVLQSALVREIFMLQS